MQQESYKPSPNRYIKSASLWLEREADFLETCLCASHCPMYNLFWEYGSPTEPYIRQLFHTNSTRGAATVRMGVPARLDEVDHYCATAPVHWFRRL